MRPWRSQRTVTLPKLNAPHIIAPARRGGVVGVGVQAIQSGVDQREVGRVIAGWNGGVDDQVEGRERGGRVEEVLLLGGQRDIVRRAILLAHVVTPAGERVRFYAAYAPDLWDEMPCFAAVVRMRVQEYTGTEKG